MSITIPAPITPGSLRDGFIVKYNTSSQAKITTGLYEANGKKYKLDSDVTLDFSSIPSAYTRYYVYIDDDASAPPAPTFIYSTTAPTWSNTKRGFYNGDDLCVGVQLSRDSNTTLDYHDVNVVNDRFVEYIYERNTFPVIQSSVAPTGNWQTPADNEVSAVVPVNTVVLRLYMSTVDAGGSSAAWAASSEYAAIYTTPNNNGVFNFRGGVEMTEISWVPLGASRNIKIGAEGDDDSIIANCAGFRIKR
jgi:hypothetical protein